LKREFVVMNTRYPYTLVIN